MQIEQGGGMEGSEFRVQVLQLTVMSGSTSLVSMKTSGLFMVHTMSQKSTVVCSKGPCTTELALQYPQRQVPHFSGACEKRISIKDVRGAP